MNESLGCDDDLIRGLVTGIMKECLVSFSELVHIETLVLFVVKQDILGVIDLYDLIVDIEEVLVLLF